MSNSGIFRRAATAATIMMSWQVAAKTARDSLFLSSYPASSLPAMIASGAVCSILLATLSSRLLRKYGPFRIIPAGYLLGALLHGIEWMLLPQYPGPIAVIVYLHVVSFGSVLLSGFWALANERFDPREARRRFGRITGFGTLGGMAGGAMAGWVATQASNAHLLLLLLVFQVGCGAVLVQMKPPKSKLRPADPPRFKETITRAPYLYSLAVLVLLVSVSAALLDYLFKSHAVMHYGKGAPLSRFFATFYVVSSVASFLAQAGASRAWLDHFGLGRTVATLPVAVSGASLFSMLFPGAWVLTITRGIELLLRGSLFRSGYELFYTPMPQAEKRTAKSVIDIGADRLGDGVGAGILQLILVLPTETGMHAILVVTTTLSAAAAWLSFRLDRSYSGVLEKNLVQQAVHLPETDVSDFTTRSVIMRTASSRTRMDEPGTSIPSTLSITSAPPTPPPEEPAFDTAMHQLTELRSGNPRKTKKLLREIGLLEPLAIPQVILMLGKDEVYREAHNALSRSIFRIGGQLSDCLLDESASYTVRARIPRLLALCDTKVAWDGLFAGLNDQRFEIRYRCGRALDAMLLRHPEFKPKPADVYAIVGPELSVSQRVWQNRQVAAEGEEDGRFLMVDQVLQERVSQSLSHVFTLLSLVLPREAVQTAFRALQTDDVRLRALAVEFLESSLPRELREPLAAHLEAPAKPAPAKAQSAQKASPQKASPATQASLQSLLDESPSIVARLEQMGFPKEKKPDAP